MFRWNETAYLGVLAVTLAWLLVVPWTLFFTSEIALFSYGVVNGIAIYAVSSTLLRIRRHRRRAKLEAYLPIRMYALNRDEETETMTVSVELQNGDVRMLDLPLEYDPRVDGGERVMREAAPELFAKGGLFEHCFYEPEAEWGEEF